MYPRRTAKRTDGGYVWPILRFFFRASRRDENLADAIYPRKWYTICVHLQVTALHTGRLGEDERDVLLVGTSTHILAYQVEDNADLFYKEVRK